MHLKESTAIVTTLMWEENIHDFIEHINDDGEPSDHVLWHSLSLELLINGHVTTPIDDGSTLKFTTIDDLVDYLMEDEVKDEVLEEVDSFIAAHGSPVV